ncbi:MAG: AMP-binding protein [Xanthomonadales bacterium]|nr:AMP-binding protein [Xanthomonadales bacterium]NIN58407.1 AMP-binding protein [Xanthomonadales bacterium]NIN73744.1 AMP-binding protein [Xanthomonadales bacterium]NIO14542.1 AMP-binding protein [Xanthomonadales bacterium]NIP10800.1 AMP-binding protein [Xanthomonadales bacterium]
MSQEHYGALQTRERLNDVALSPVSFLWRTADIYPDRIAVIYGERRYTWQALRRRVRCLAGALHAAGVGRGDTVSVIAANTPELLEAHYGVPVLGAVLNAINIRLDADTVSYILQHSDCRVLLVDSEFVPLVEQALADVGDKPAIIEIVDDEAASGVPPSGSYPTYQAWLESAAEYAGTGLPETEYDAIALNYTSGTSGRPKGVVYHHRGAYLMALGTVAAWQLPRHPRYLYTVPMFHCNGWCHVWAMTIMAGTFVCHRKITAESVFAALREHRITHFGAAPIVLAMLAQEAEGQDLGLAHAVRVLTAGAPPPSRVLERVQALGLEVTHVYGLTESFGHVVWCDWQDQWDQLDAADQAEIKARQGVRFPMMECVQVLDRGSGEPVPADGATLGEVAMRGNTLLRGYYKDPQATRAAFAGGWFHTGDLGVVHPDGYLEIRDRLKDIIISGGENISSVEVESTLFKHPAVAAAAVVAMPHEKWGEVPCAFVELVPGGQASAEEIMAFCRERLAGFKCPKKVVFRDLPKTATGKIQKFELRDWMARELSGSGGG